VFIDFSPDRREEMLHLLTEASGCAPLQPDDPENLAMFTEWFNVEWMPKVRALLQRTTTPGGDEFEAERRERQAEAGRIAHDEGRHQQGFPVAGHGEPEPENDPGRERSRSRR
jgi:hypothetical protein